MGYLKSFELSQVQNLLESSDQILREAKLIFDAYGTDGNLKNIYARRLENLFFVNLWHNISLIPMLLS